MKKTIDSGAYFQYVFNMLFTLVLWLHCVVRTVTKRKSGSAIKLPPRAVYSSRMYRSACFSPPGTRITPMAAIRNKAIERKHTRRRFSASEDDCVGCPFDSLVLLVFRAAFSADLPNVGDDVGDACGDDGVRRFIVLYNGMKCGSFTPPASAWPSPLVAIYFWRRLLECCCCAGWRRVAAAPEVGDW